MLTPIFAIFVCSIMFIVFCKKKDKKTDLSKVPQLTATAEASNVPNAKENEPPKINPPQPPQPAPKSGAPISKRARKTMELCSTQATDDLDVNLDNEIKKLEERIPEPNSASAPKSKPTAPVNEGKKNDDKQTATKPASADKEARCKIELDNTQPMSDENSAKKSMSNKKTKKSEVSNAGAKGKS